MAPITTEIKMILVTNIVCQFGDIPTSLQIDTNEVDVEDIETIVQHIQDNHLDNVISFDMNGETYDFSHYFDLDDDSDYQSNLVPDNSHYEGEWQPYRSNNR